MNKVSFWTHSLCSFDSNMIDVQLDSLKKSNLLYSNNKSQEFSNQHHFDNKQLKLSDDPKQNETSLSSVESLLKTNGILNNNKK